MGRWRISSSTLLTVEASCCLSITRHLVYRHAGTASEVRLLRGQCGSVHRLQVTCSEGWGGCLRDLCAHPLRWRSPLPEQRQVLVKALRRGLAAGLRRPGDNLLRHQPLLPVGEFGPDHHRRRTEATSPAIFTTIQPEPLVFSGRAA